jgi:hypothetical protein
MRHHLRNCIPCVGTYNRRMEGKYDVLFGDTLLFHIADNVITGGILLYPYFQPFRIRRFRL